MGLMHQDEHHIDAGSLALGQILERLYHRLEQIMATLEELNAKIDDLQAAVDADQASDAAVAAALQAEIDRLTGLLAGAVTQADLDGIRDRLAAIQADVSGPNS